MTDSSTVWYPSTDTSDWFIFKKAMNARTPVRCDTLKKILLVSYDAVGNISEKFRTGEYDRNGNLETVVYFIYRTFVIDGYIVYPTYDERVGSELGSVWYLDSYKKPLPKTFTVWGCVSLNPY